MQDWSNNTAVVSEDTKVVCKAEAIMNSKADAVSDNAVSTKSFMEETCMLRLDTKPLETTVEKMATAVASVCTLRRSSVQSYITVHARSRTHQYTSIHTSSSRHCRASLYSNTCVDQHPWLLYLQVYNEAYATCNVKKGGDLTGYGCSVATSFGSAFASACAQATSDALVSLDTQKCDCDLASYVSADAWAGVYTRIFSHVEQQVEAYACSSAGNLQPTAEIRRECVVNTAATALAQVCRSLSWHSAIWHGLAMSRKFCVGA